MKTIKAEELKDKMKEDDFCLIDVREEDEFAAGHPEGAQNFPLSQLESSYQQLNRERDYYVICQKGGRSARACDFLESQGYRVVNVAGGVEAYPETLVQE